MEKIFDYTASENNCFELYHNTKEADKFVKKIIIDFENNVLEIFYHEEIKSIPIENELYMVIYNRFGIKQNSYKIYETSVINKTENSIKYSCKIM